MHARRLSPWLLVPLAFGCGGPPPAAAPESVDEAWTVTEPVLEEGVTLLGPVCAEGAAEACDAVDQDCDGRVDEGCGDAAAPLVAAIAWTGPADVDLVFAGPDGRGATYVRAGCGGGAMERAVFAEPAVGTYRVEARHAGACGGDGPVTVSVSLSLAGRAFGPFNRPLVAGATAPLARFAVTLDP